MSNDQENQFFKDTKLFNFAWLMKALRPSGCQGTLWRMPPCRGLSIGAHCSLDLQHFQWRKSHPIWKFPANHGASADPTFCWLPAFSTGALKDLVSDPMCPLRPWKWMLPFCITVTGRRVTISTTKVAKNTAHLDDRYWLCANDELTIYLLISKTKTGIVYTVTGCNESNDSSRNTGTNFSLAFAFSIAPFFNLHVN